MNTKTNRNTQYSKEIAYPTIILAIVCLTIYSLSMYFAIVDIIPIWLAMVINTIMAYLLFTPTHEAGHGNISGMTKHKWVDEVVGWLSSQTLFAPYYIIKVIHFRHHVHTNHPEKDPDHWVATKKLIPLIFYSFTIGWAYMKTGLQILMNEKNIPEKTKRELIIGYSVFTVQMTIFGLIMYYTDWTLPILLWLVPGFAALALLAFAFDWLPHHPHESRKPFLNTRVFDIPGLSVLLLSQNFHLIHHLYPSIPFYNYNKVYLEMEDEIIEKGVNIIKW